MKISTMLSKEGLVLLWILWFKLFLSIFAECNEFDAMFIINSLIAYLQWKVKDINAQS